MTHRNLVTDMDSKKVVL